MGETDLISRQAAIDALDEIRHALWEIDIPSPTVPEYVEHHEQVQSVWKLLDKKQKELYVLPSAQPERWIPCSERLPEIGQSVLLSVGGMYSAEGCLREDGDWAQFRWDAIQRKDMVGAWKPLPEPYKEEQK